MAFDEYSQHPPNVFSEVISKALADHLGYAIFLGTIKGKNQLYRTYQAGKDDPDWFTVWQDVDGSLETETDATTTLHRQALEDDRRLIAKGLMTHKRSSIRSGTSPAMRRSRGPTTPRCSQRPGRTGA